MRNLPWLLVSARVRKNLLYFLQVSCVFAVGLLALLSIQGISGATGKSLVSFSLSKLPVGQGNFTVNSTQVISSPRQRQEISQYLQKKLAGAVEGGVAPEIIYSELADTHGVRFFFGAVDQLGTKVHLTSGRLPRTCTHIRCEVIQIGGERKLAPRPDSLGITVVGFGEISNNLIFAGTMGPPVGTALLIASGIASGSSLGPLALSHGSNGWVAKADLKRIEQLGVDEFSARVVAFADQLSIDYPNLILTWPQDALIAAGDQGKSVQGKLTLLKFAVATLLLAFAALIAFRRRKDQVGFRASLSRIGTPKRTLAWEIYLESAVPILFGGALALLLSILLPKVLALFNFQVGLLDIYKGWESSLTLGLVLLTLIIGVTLSWDRAWRRAQAVSALLVIAFFALYMAQSHLSDSRYSLIPFLYTAGPLLLTYLLLRVAQKFWREKSEALFIIMKEFFSLWQGVAALVALTVILAVLAMGYSSGLSQQISRTARNEVPLDISLLTGPNLIRPLDLASAEQYSQLEVGASAYPILRTGTSIRGQSSVSDSLSLIGLPAAALAATDSSLAKFARSPAFQSAAPESGIEIHSIRSITVSLQGIPKEIELLAWFRTPRGTHVSETFLGQGDVRTLKLAGVVPIGSSFVTFEFRETSNYLSRRLHANGEGNYSVPQLKGIGSITRLLFDGVEVQLPAPIWRSRNFPYLFDGQSIFLSPKRDLGTPSVVTDAATASLAVKGKLTLLASGNRYMVVQVGKVVQNFPSAGDRFVVMELGVMQAEIAKNDLGAIDPIELWIKSQHPDAYVKKLSSTSYQGVTVENRLTLERSAGSDPTSVGLLTSYRIALGFAMLITLLIALGALPELYKEGRGVLTHLEVVGYRPRVLRRTVRASWRTAILAGVVVGLLLGAITSRIFISSSLPFLQEVVVLLGAYLFVELAGALLTRPFFKERALVI